MFDLPEMHLQCMQSKSKSCSLSMHVMSCQNTACHLQKGKREGRLTPRNIIMQVLCMHGAAAAEGQCAVPYLPERRPDVHPAGV